MICKARDIKTEEEKQIRKNKEVKINLMNIHEIKPSVCALHSSYAGFFSLEIEGGQLFKIFRFNLERHKIQLWDVIKDTIVVCCNNFHVKQSAAFSDQKLFLVFCLEQLFNLYLVGKYDRKRVRLQKSVAIAEKDFEVIKSLFA